MTLNKCKSCNKYTLKDICPKCKKETISAHYKFPMLRDAPSRSATHKRR